MIITVQSEAGFWIRTWKRPRPAWHSLVYSVEKATTKEAAREGPWRKELPPTLATTRATARDDEMVLSQPKTNTSCLMIFFNIRAACCMSTWGSSITQIWRASLTEKVCKVYKQQLLVPWSDKREVRGPLKEAMERPDYLSEESKVLEANADRQQPKPFCELLLNKNNTRKAARVTIILSKMKIIEDLKKTFGRADEGKNSWLGLYSLRHVMWMRPGETRSWGGQQHFGGLREMFEEKHWHSGTMCTTAWLQEHHPPRHWGNKGTAALQRHKQKKENSYLFRILGRFHLFWHRTVLVNTKLFRLFCKEQDSGLEQ